MTDEELERRDFIHNLRSAAQLAKARELAGESEDPS
jgi:hypothetical protein